MLCKLNRWEYIIALKKQNNSGTRKHLLECAKAEFMEKGFTKASLRSICTKAGVTTGALYFFFKDKDELFCEVVSDLVNRLNTIIKEHYILETREADNGFKPGHDSNIDYECTVQLVHELYRYRDEVLLVLTKAQGSTMEYWTDGLVNRMDEHNLYICEAMCKANNIPMVDKKIIHWMSHSQIDMFIFMVTHIDDEEEALSFAAKGVNYLVAGWYGIMK